MNRLIVNAKSHLSFRVHLNVISPTIHNSVRTVTHLERPGQRVPKTVEQPKNGEPIKFSASDAHINYRASDNFYGGDESSLPKSHNAVLAATGIFGFYYMIFLRDDVDADGGAYLFKPLHETIPHLAIPLTQAAIAENKRLGYNTTKLEKRLAELLKDSDEREATTPRKLIEN